MNTGLRHPFFNPLWRRVALTVFLTLWTAFEFSMGNALWGALFAGLTALCLWTFFLSWEDVEPDD